MSAIGHQGVFRLDGWSRQIHTEFQGFRATWGNDHEGNTYAYTAITHSGQPSQAVQLRIPFITRRETSSSPKSAPQPPACNACQLSHTPGLACSAFARHYSRNHNCFLFLWVLRCFTSPRSLPHPYTFKVRSPDMTPVLSRFPHSDIHGSQLAYQLPMAYRRLQRPSSALDAKASTDRPQ